MTTVVLASVRGAPGVTTASLLLASRLDASVLVEADLAGGVVAVRYHLGREPGLTTLAAGGSRSIQGWQDHVQNAGGVPVLVGPDSPEAAESLWRTAGDRITHVLGQIEGWVVVDAGRFHRSAAIVKTADVLVLLAKPVADQMVGLTHALQLLRRSRIDEAAVVLVGDGDYRAADIESSLGCAVLAHLPDDEIAANHLVDGNSSQVRFNRSRLVRAVNALGNDIEGLVDRRRQVAVSVP